MRHLAFLAAILCALSSSAQAANPTPEVLKVRRCWRKMSYAFFGELTKPDWRAVDLWGPDSGLFYDDPKMNPPDYAKAFLGGNWAERFASFVNSKWQRNLGTLVEQNTPYHIAKYVLTKGLPWKQVFLGKYNVTYFEGHETISEDPNGLGYFRVQAWQRQHAGNEVDGYKIFTAYRIMNNTIGLKLVPAANNNVGDASATGRQQAGCRGCHFEGAYALDKVARVLTRRVGFGDSMTFIPSTESPQTILGGRSIHDDEELVTTLVNSDAFTFNTCRLAFEFLHGRPETTCEAAAFDQCITAFEKEGTMQAAVLALVQAPGFCQ